METNGLRRHETVWFVRAVLVAAAMLMFAGAAYLGTRTYWTYRAERALAQRDKPAETPRLMSLPTAVGISLGAVALMVLAALFLPRRGKIRRWALAIGGLALAFTIGRHLYPAAELEAARSRAARIEDVEAVEREFQDREQTIERGFQDRKETIRKVENALIEQKRALKEREFQLQGWEERVRSAEQREEAMRREIEPLAREQSRLAFSLQVWKSRAEEAEAKLTGIKLPSNK